MKSKKIEKDYVETKRGYIETVSLSVKLIIALLAMILFIAIGYEWGKSSKEEIPTPLILPMPTVAIDLCYPPFNAIPNDSISDVDAFRLAAEVISNLKVVNGDSSMNIVLNLPVGHYILDDDVDFKDAKVRIKTPPILGIEGTDISISGGVFMFGWNN